MTHKEYILKLQPKGDKKPIFLIHPISGHAYNYKLLSRKFGKDQPVYGIENISRLQNEPDFISIESLAIQYFEAIKSIQPKGPYTIISWCMGSFFAYELCSLIERQGEKLLPLMLISPPIQQKIEDEAELGLKVIFSAMGVSIPNFDIKKSELVNLSSYKSLQYIIEKLRIQNQKKLEDAFTDAEFCALERLVKAHLYNIFATENYQLRSQIEKIILFTSTPPSFHQNKTDTNYIVWQNYSRSKILNQEIPGDENSILTEPMVTILSNHMLNYCRSEGVY